MEHKELYQILKEIVKLRRNLLDTSVDDGVVVIANLCHTTKILPSGSLKQCKEGQR